MEPFIDFYTGARPDHRGRYLRDILQWSDDQLEAVHDYIQWLFPLPEPSPVNPDAPILRNEAISNFQSTDQLRAAWLRMLRFYGLEYRNEAVVEAPNFHGRAGVWLTPGNHNHLRITRTLRSIRLLGLAQESSAFFHFLTELYGKRPDAITARTFQFWTATQVK